MAKFIGVDKIYQALYDIGAVEEDPQNVRRVVIDLEANSVARIYIEKFADDEKLSAGLTAGLRVEQATAAPGEVR
jgi:hypothetical protein